VRTWLDVILGPPRRWPLWPRAEGDGTDVARLDHGVVLPGARLRAAHGRQGHRLRSSQNFTAVPGTGL
jgi:hypothetical protein